MTVGIGRTIVQNKQLLVDSRLLHLPVILIPQFAVFGAPVEGECPTQAQRAPLADRSGKDPGGCPRVTCSDSLLMSAICRREFEVEAVPSCCKVVNSNGFPDRAMSVFWRRAMIVALMAIAKLLFQLFGCCSHEGSCELEVGIVRRALIPQLDTQ